ncbi:PTS system mannose/fructose/sorbose family transporter subunit IID [Deferribacter abyssi]|uniref:PTS system mannose/fructose/sorbose family transporter subunit IID n=1 Tax=Deferribacter abyssi TaxID=213806 RepID=UPI003C177FC4
MSKFKRFIKSLFYQANWNYENMQGTGFVYLLDEINKEKEFNVPDKIIKRELSYFNTHPFLFMFVVGVWFKEFLNQGDPESYKRIYSSAFGALGDSFFWHALRPASFVFAAIIAFYNPMIALIFYLLFFNFFHFFFLYKGFDIGFTYGKETISWFNKIFFNKWASYFDIITSFFMGLFLVVMLHKTGFENNFNFYIMCLGYFLVGTTLAKKVDVMFSLIMVIIITLVLKISVGI